MKTYQKFFRLFRFPIFLLLLACLFASMTSYPAYAQGKQDATPTATEEPPSAGVRPILVVQSYSFGQDSVTPGDQITLKVKIYNAGKDTASNVMATFTPGDLVPLKTGGLVPVKDLGPGDHAVPTQPLIVSDTAWGKGFISVSLVLNYVDSSGAAYTDTFALSIPVYTSSVSAPTATATPTATTAPVFRPQLVISSYTTDVAVLQPGLQFAVELKVQNVGNADAKRVTMIVGGGSATPSESGGTPVPGGTSGSSGEFTNFAPLGSSNVQSIGDLPQGQSLTAKQSLIVNVTTNPGAYSMKISFTYLDEKGHILTDDQVITLLVYTLPQVEVNFYQPTGLFYVGQTGPLPLQIVNLGRKTAILGTMKVTAEGAQVMNNSVLVGTLDPGGYFPLDAVLIPIKPGPVNLVITVDYTDDFNQAQKITKNLQVEVNEAPAVPPGMPGGTSEPGGSASPVVPGGQVKPGESSGPIGPSNGQAETAWQKVMRFIRGLLGLDSGQTTPTITKPIVEPSVQSTVIPQNPAIPLKGP